jgi:hypothetical protein
VEGETETLTVLVAGSTVTIALALFDGSAALVARIDTLVALLTAGAVKRPPSVMEPALVDQVTPVLLVPCTVATNCCPPPEVMVVEVGDTATLTLEPDETDIVAAALFVVSATLVARTVTVVAVLTEGAVNSPELLTVPAEVDQLTAVLLAPFTVAENCCVWPDVTLALRGETETLTVDPAAVLIVRCARSLAFAPWVSDARSQKYLLTETVGVPVTAPVAEFNDKPAGRLPSVIEYVYGAAPPAATNFPE